jgi:hypothetical protein
LNNAINSLKQASHHLTQQNSLRSWTLVGYFF